MEGRSAGQTEKRRGRLVGWLVSYGLNDQGVAYEVRSGRTFLGSQDDTDHSTIVVDESSIDSPHLAIKANQKHRVLVQDVFSRSGTFIQRGDSDQEERLEGPTELGHGDWIRIGSSTRFQFCLIQVSGR
jgi:hypothetical protein